MHLRYIKDIPVDYDGEMYVPISVLVLPAFKRCFDIIRFEEKPVHVDGKQQFYRVVIKRKSGVIPEMLITLKSIKKIKTRKL